MAHITPELSKKDCNTYNSLLKKIEDKILRLAHSTYAQVAYGEPTSDCVSTDVFIYRDILVQKMKGCGCYECVSLQSLISKINQITA